MILIIQSGSVNISPREVVFLSPLSQQTPDGQMKQLPDQPRMTELIGTLSWAFGGLESEGMSGQALSGGYCCKVRSCGGHIPHYVDQAAYNKREKQRQEIERSLTLFKAQVPVAPEAQLHYCPPCDFVRTLSALFK